jgi:hypothetical protein
VRRNETQTSQQEKVEARWATLGYDRTRGSADPVVGLLVSPFVVQRVSGLCCALGGGVFSLILVSVPVIFNKDIWKQKELCRFES